MAEPPMLAEARGIPFQPPAELVLPVRWLLALKSFFVRKPLGGLGLVIIALMAFVAIAAPIIDRYPPDQVFSVPNPAYDPDLAARAKTDPFIRLNNPPEKFIEGGRITAQNPSSGHWLGTDLAGRDLPVICHRQSH